MEIIEFEEHLLPLKSETVIKFEEKDPTFEENYILKDYQQIKLEDNVKVEEEEDKTTYDFNEDEVDIYPLDELSKKVVNHLGNSCGSSYGQTSTHTLNNLQAIAISEEEKQFNQEEDELSASVIYCYYCSYKAFDKNTLNYHLRKKHLGNSMLRLPLIKSKHTGERPFSCPHCEYSCTKSSYLKQHIQSKHTRKRPFSCPHCEKTFSSKYYLKRHIQLKHTGERPFSCPHCEYSCIQSSHLKSHIQLKHTEERPFLCPHCDYRFKLSWTLKQHIQSKHTEERPFSCIHCEYSCTKSSNLKQHIQSKHTEECPFSCPHCDNRFKLSSHLKRHIQSIHTEERPFSCPHCEYSCTQSSNLKRHIQSKHTGERPFY